MVGDDLKHWKGTIFGPVSEKMTLDATFLCSDSLPELCSSNSLVDGAFTDTSVPYSVSKSDTCYEGGTFLIDIVIPNEYPFKPPKVSEQAFEKHRRDISSLNLALPPANPSI